MSLIKDSKTTKYALRKTSVAFGSVAVATVLAVAGAASVSADEVASATTTVTSTTATPTRSTTETKEVAVPDYLETAKTNAATTGLEATETEAKTQADEKPLSKIMRSKPLLWIKL